MLVEEYPIHIYILNERNRFTISDIYYRDYAVGKKRALVSSAVELLLNLRCISIIEYGMFGEPIYKVREDKACILRKLSTIS